MVVIIENQRGITAGSTMVGSPIIWWQIIGVPTIRLPAIYMYIYIVYCLQSTRTHTHTHTYVGSTPFHHYHTDLATIITLQHTMSPIKLGRCLAIVQEEGKLQ